MTKNESDDPKCEACASLSLVDNTLYENCTNCLTFPCQLIRFQAFKLGSHISLFLHYNVFFLCFEWIAEICEARYMGERVKLNTYMFSQEHVRLG